MDKGELKALIFNVDGTLTDNGHSGHRVKTAHNLDLLESGDLPLRPGGMA